MTQFSDLKGKIITAIEGADKYGDQIVFTCSDGSRYRMWHEQNCCESVAIDDICGDLQDIINQEILVAEERSSDGESSEWGDSSTWTFYVLATIKGYVDIRWYGSSNGYYSEGVSFDLIEKGAQDVQTLD